MRTENHTPGQAAGADDKSLDARSPQAVGADRESLDAEPTQAAGADRESLDAAAVRAAVVRPGGRWRAIEVTGVTGSTNADLLARAADGEPEGLVLAAEEQSAGRGRLGRGWVSPPRAALTFSLLVRPGTVPRARHGWIPLLAGVAVASAVRAVAALDARLKWPNDVLADGAKLGGILAEATGDAVVVGIGLNVSTDPAELPPPGPGGLAATSLRAAGSACLDRDLLLAEILASFERWYQPWRRAAGDPERSGLREAYTRLCDTTGRGVRVELPGGQVLSGGAVGIDSGGRLVVRTSPGSEVAVAAGDVVHLR
jgi:BirA family transcriptional regulator, biotin operon repressor / biotin---[acetyl-CoA-carboxylase] ligase